VDERRSAGPNGRRLATDVPVDPEGDAYFTDSLSPVIYEVGPEGEATVFAQNELFMNHDGLGLNDIAFHADGFLLVATGGRDAFYRIPLVTPEDPTKVELSADTFLRPHRNRPPPPAPEYAPGRDRYPGWRERGRTSVTTVYAPHENPGWFPPFARAFEAEGAEVIEWLLTDGVLDLDSVPPEGIFWSRISASAHTRDHGRFKDYARCVLSWLEAHGRRTVNGRRVLELEMSKVDQLTALRAAGIETPRIVAAVGPKS